MLDHLRRAETLAQTLGDPLRLGRVYAEMGAMFWVAGELDRAIVYGQRALALAATLGHVGLQARAHLILGRASYDVGDYPRAVESLERNVATLQGDLLSERFGSNEIIAAISRTWLSLLPRRTRGVHGGARHGRRRAPDRRDRQSVPSA